MELEEGKIYTFNVKGVRETDRAAYYVLDGGDEELSVKQYAFQREHGIVPKEMQCLVKGFNGNVPILVQNLTQVIGMLYKEGDEHSFTVKEDRRNEGYYELRDGNGLLFRLTDYKGTVLNKFQKVNCRVTRINGIKVELELVSDNDNIPFFTLEDVLSRTSLDEKEQRWVALIFKRARLLADVRLDYDAGKSTWVLNAISLVSRNMQDWIRSDVNHKMIILNAYHDVCLMLLEKTTFLDGFDDTERRRYQQRLSGNIQQSEDYIETMRLMETGEYAAKVDDILSSLENSGYLYQPERKLRILMCIFSIKKEIMGDKMQSIFGSILSRSQENWMDEPFRSAFLTTIGMYIAGNAEMANHMTDTSSPENMQSMKNIIKAIAIKLLLTDSSDETAMHINRSMLYRYASMLASNATYADSLINKAYKCLFTCFSPKLEFTWSEVGRMDTYVLCNTLATRPLTGLIAEAPTFDNGRAQLQLTEQAITLSPLHHSKDMKKAFPDKVFTWKDIHVYLNGGLKEKVSENSSDISQFDRMWHELELSLFEKVRYTAVKKSAPEDGDTVFIYITGKDKNDPMVYNCAIDDDDYEGHGQITVKDFVHYNMIHSSLESFQSSEGKPLLLEAKVKYKDDDTLSFDALDCMGEFIYDTVKVGDHVSCKVTASVGFNSSLCITENGYTIKVFFSPKYPKPLFGSFIEAEITNKYPNGNVTGQYTGNDGTEFKEVEAFERLIASYSSGEHEAEEGEEESDDDTKSAEMLLEPEYVRELINITDRQALIHKKLKDTFNYLELSRILSLLLDDGSTAEYFSRRMEIVKMLYNFSVNGRIDMTELNLQYERNKDIIHNFPDMEGRLQQLKIISKMDEPWQDEGLWKLTQTTRDSEIRELAETVLAYNMLRNINMPEQCTALKAHVNKLLNLSIKMPETVYIGEEDQITEFKTSIVYPPDNNMAPNIEQQTDEILRVICGFMNARGGTLYIGVNDHGIVSGLSEDIKWFGGDMHSSKDKFAQHIVNNVRRHLGVMANEYLDAQWQQKGGKMVYTLDIKPSRDIVKCDGKCWVRQGSVTTEIYPADMRKFKEKRERDFGMTEEQ